MTTIFISLAVGTIVIALQITLLVIILRKQKQTENEYYTDYVHKNLILRIFKPEFEYQAIGNIQRGKLLDQGTFSQFYLWALIEK